MKILYFDCFNGASGDMILGALLDAGLPLEALRDALGSLALEDCRVDASPVLRAGISATRFQVVEGDAEPAAVAAVRRHEHGGARAHHHHDHDHPHDHAHGDHAQSHAHPHRSLPEIFALIDRSSLRPAGKQRAKALFERLATAEAAIHQMPVERVHLHEVGALDSIVDIVGAVFALEWFAPDRVIVSPLNTGRGMVRSAHGVFPVPAPATVRLLGDAPVFARGPEAELLTPTGALVLSDYAHAYGPLPPMRISAVGYGAGSRDFADTPNVLRVLIGEAAEDAPTDVVVEVSCEIDDMNPQLYGPLMDSLYAAGAVEVFYAPVQMKKGRPGTLVTVLTSPDRRGAVVDTLFRETTTIGVRYAERRRECLVREVTPIETPYGTVRIKLARRGAEVVNTQPEFEDCAARAREHGVPVKDVHAAALAAWHKRS